MDISSLVNESYSSFSSTRYNPSPVRFIDLFAGLGGFHVGMSNAGFECVFASELDHELRELYAVNHSLIPVGDIRHIREEEIPEHDVICAGFPCQPFSLAGSQKGRKCPKSGKLIDEVVRIAKYHKPQVILLENVPKIKTISEGQFWSYLNKAFSDIGYKLQHKIISPVDLGIPQNRKRIFIMLSREDIDVNHFEWPASKDYSQQFLEEYLDDEGTKELQKEKLDQLRHWQVLVKHIGRAGLNHLGLVAPEFGATYPMDFGDLTLEELKAFKGAYGQPLSSCNSMQELLDKMPSYTRRNKRVADWVYQSASNSRKIYEENQSFIDSWKVGLDKRNNSWQILEWRGHRSLPDIFKHLIQFRASGIRISKPEIAPSLISMTSTQTPIIGSQCRYISKFEAAKLQHLHGLRMIPHSESGSFKAIGNAVNAKIVQEIGESLNKILI
ncbi:DNA (cytosine-5-)-methyltransferase [Alteromonadaceae bacterium M269]|nr:DNA (cytosine-5-)-methyltransferase [Alteromonadaceae bacterium M269]